jgi:hypothetical protein
MTGVRNGVLARGTVPVSGVLALGTVPANETWLVKAIHLFSASASVGTTTVQLTASGGTSSVQLPPFSLRVNEGQLWAGWFALNQGDSVSVSSSQGTVCWLSGAALPGTVT